jgi:hypothetical protein
MTKLGAEEAELRNNIWTLYSVALNSKKAIAPENVASYTSGFIQGTLSKLKERSSDGPDEGDFFHLLMKILAGAIGEFEERRIGLRIVVPGADINNSSRRTYQAKVLEQGVALDACRSLNILVYHSQDPVVFFEPYPAKIDLQVMYFSELGVEFMGACQPA